jgi:hypothetical protein
MLSTQSFWANSNTRSTVEFGLFNGTLHTTFSPMHKLARRRRVSSWAFLQAVVADGVIENCTSVKKVKNLNHGRQSFSADETALKAVWNCGI